MQIRYMQLLAALMALSAFFLCQARAFAEANECQKELTSSLASAALARVQKAYGATKALHANFVQHSTMVALDQEERAEGTVRYLKPGRMKWSYESPEPQEFLMRDETVWFYQPNQNQLVIDSLQGVLLTDLPVAFLMGIGDLERDFRVVQGCENRDSITLSLLPKSATQGEGDLRSFELHVNRNSMMPVGARVTDVGGNITAIELSEINANAEIVSASDFTPEFPTGTDVTDRRKSARRLPLELEQILGGMRWVA